ncbi:helix-turn-helix domain-containing protein [Actinokineospora diospyrosa]|uniref:Helix-turn-helix domain-containing protein n=1 Tax=Actinokineospora diospyrosa TaxID=103728 RepID=A0ABT1IC59_9PSEU|nr:helix-turn-helix domain-containing protein [Actinokineospora diospyrosa]MCP2270220.1 Helix-turn-helix domain-containing protein [Actinokineospora diospyrosa]
MLDEHGESRREAARRFAEHLRELRAAAGQPSLRQMAARSGRISHTTLHDCLSGARLPSWEATREFVRACAGTSRSGERAGSPRRHRPGRAMPLRRKPNPKKPNPRPAAPPPMPVSAALGAC